LKRFKTVHRKILTRRIWIERIQKRYPRSWRFIKDVRRALGVALNAPEPSEGPSGMRGNRDEAMKNQTM
jgi:hypothetical protein